MTIDANYNAKTDIYKYIAYMRYIVDDTVIEIDNLQIKSIAIDYDYKNMNMPMIFITASIHRDHVDIIEENQNSGIIIFNIKKAIANSDMPDLYVDYINDKFIYFITRYTDSDNVNFNNSNEDEEYDDNKDREDLYEVVSLGLLALDHINKNKKNINEVISGNLCSVMFHLTDNLNILLEPPTDDVRLNNLYIPPMNSISKTLELLNSMYALYNTPYRFFIDFDCSYLISSSGKPIAKEDEDSSTILIMLRQSKDVEGKIQGMYKDEKNNLCIIDIDESDCEIADNHIMGKSYSKLSAVNASGSTIDKVVTDMSSSYINEKIKNIRLCNDNLNLLNTMISSINSSSIQILVQKTDIDSSILTINKEYMIQANDVYDKEKYNGKYILTRKRELYVRGSEEFTMDTMLLFEKA